MKSKQLAIFGLRDSADPVAPKNKKWHSLNSTSIVERENSQNLKFHSSQLLEHHHMYICLLFPGLLLLTSAIAGKNLVIQSLIRSQSKSWHAALGRRTRGSPPQSRAHSPDSQQKAQGNHQASKPEGPSPASSLLDRTAYKGSGGPKVVNFKIQSLVSSFQSP